ncbi:MAG: copper amine oxidase N-terminal domain-containing protein [Candidatus Moranbacteria bacterium]|nr:copper amine oxidase N-terminal domain-containing protein [Candidatus Moranbacteria bacterium]
MKTKNKNLIWIFLLGVFLPELVWGAPVIESISGTLGNGQSITVDNAPVIRDDVTYAPVRFIAEQLGYEVTYDQEYKEVCLNNKSLEE